MLGEGDYFKICGTIPLMTIVDVILLNVTDVTQGFVNLPRCMILWRFVVPVFHCSTLKEYFTYLVLPFSKSIAN